MRRIVLVISLTTLCLAPGIAAAKLPFFGLEVQPLRPDVDEPITITMTCYADAQHTRPRPSCFGERGVMAWVHPLDNDGELTRSDWLSVEGHGIPSGASRGTIRLAEPGIYDVLPLWRRWAYTHSEGFPDPIRVKVEAPWSVVPIGVAAAVGVAVVLLLVGTMKRRTVA